MADLVVPQLGESITEAVVARWLKQVGEAVAADEPVAELETDKVTVQLPSPAAGVMGEQKAAVGATVHVGDVIGSVKAGEGKVKASSPSTSTSTSTSTNTNTNTNTSTSTSTSTTPVATPPKAGQGES